MGTVFLIVIALFVGWATPQPAFAAKITTAIVTKVKELKAKADAS